MFYVGQKVVCVNAAPRSPNTYWGDIEKLVEGSVYTIRGIRPHDHRQIFLLHEVDRDAVSKAIFGDACGYGSDRFRPLVERKTDIGVFIALLNPAPVDA